MSLGNLAGGSANPGPACGDDVKEGGPNLRAGEGTPPPRGFGALSGAPWPGAKARALRTTSPGPLWPVCCSGSVALGKLRPCLCTTGLITIITPTSWGHVRMCKVLSLVPV